MYDVIILGSGPAGLTAAIYTGRANKKTLVLAGASLGGQTGEIAKLIISRVGANSELWINSDTHQTDARVYEKDNGITKMIERLAGNPLFGYIYLPFSERGEVANLATLLDD